MEGAELIEASPSRNIRNATAVDSRPGDTFVDHNDPALLLHSMQEREEVGILAASLSNIEK